MILAAIMAGFIVRARKSPWIETQGESSIAEAGKVRARKSPWIETYKSGALVENMGQGS